MNHKNLSIWGPRLLVLILAVVAGFAAMHAAGLLHSPEGVASVLGGVKILHSVGPLVAPDTWSVTTMTDAINRFPVTPTKIGASGLFRETSITTPTASFDYKDGGLSLVAHSPRGSEPTPQRSTKGKNRVISAAHLTVSDAVLAQDLDAVRGFGSVTTEDARAKIINDKLAMMRVSLEVTREFHRMGALRGQVLDKDGTVLTDLFEAFGVTKQTLDMDLTNSATDVRAKLLAAKRLSEAKLGGLLVRGWRVYSSATFQDALTGHDKVKEAFRNTTQAAANLAGDTRDSFLFANVEFIEYSATVSGQVFVPEGKAILIPIVDGLYELYNAPADYTDTVNTPGLAFYARGEDKRMGKGWDIEAQSNPLAVCKRPEALIELALDA